MNTHTYTNAKRYSKALIPRWQLFRNEQYGGYSAILLFCGYVQREEKGKRRQQPTLLVNERVIRATTGVCGIGMPFNVPTVVRTNT